MAFAQERGRLLSAQAGGDAAESSIELVGDRPLSFTTLKLRSPPRIVVDFAETDLALPVRDLAVDDGTIRRVAAARAGQKTARVVIELAADAEFVVRAHGSTVEVRVPRIAPLFAKAEPPGATAAEPAAAPSPQRESSSAPSAAVPLVAAAARPIASPPPEAVPQAGPSPAVAAVESRRAPPGGADAPKISGAPAPDSESQKRASLPTVSLAGSGAPRPAPAESPAARRRREQEERVAAYAVAQRAAAEKAAAAQKSTRERRLAAVDKTAAADQKPGPALAAPRHFITGIGFRPEGDGAVIVRSDHPLEASVSAEGNAVVLHLASATIPLPNNRRPLDTHFFNGPVQRVVPLAVEGGTDLRIELREHAQYQLAQSVGVLTVTFSVPR